MTQYERALKLVREDGLNLYCLAQKFRDDMVTVKEAIKENPEAFRYASKRLRNNSEILTLAIMRGSLVALEKAPEEFLDNKVVMLEAVKKNTSALQYASERLKKDKDLLALVR